MWSTNTRDREAVYPITLCILRLIVAILVAGIVLVSLLDGLSTAGRKIQGVSSLAVSQYVVGDISTLCQTPTLDIAKVVDPSDPAVGGVVTISFIITGLNLKPVDVVLALDVSSSMDGSRIDAAKVAAEAFVTRTQATDWIAVVAFSSTAWLTQPWTTDKYGVITTIRGIGTEECESACTNIEDGIYEAYQALIAPTHDHVSGTVKAIILLSDGLANRSNHPDDPWTDTYTAEMRTLSQATEARKCGILIYTIGLGKDHNRMLLQDIADITDGKYFAATDVATLTAIYQEIAMGWRNIVITDVLRPGVNVDCDRMPGGWGCFKDPDGFTTVTYTINDERPVDDPLVLSFTATVNLTPDYETQMVNAPGSCSHYDGPGNPFRGPNDPPCQNFGNPRICIRPYLTDTYEPDDSWRECVQPISPGERLLRNFSHSGDADWIKSEAWSGEVHTFTTYTVSDGIGNILLELYTATSELDLTRVATGTNSLVRIPAVPSDGSSYYYLRISSVNDQYGCGTRYGISFEHSPLAGFTLLVTPSAHTLFPGESVSFLVELASVAPGFTSPVVLGVGGVPAGASYSFVPSEITSGTQATLFITTTGATPLGSYGLAITGTVGELERSTTATLRVVKAKIFLPIIMKE